MRCYVGSSPHVPVHPRARGEHHELTFPLTHDLGSSPRTRGTSEKYLFASITGRFLPAHAGNIQFLNLKQFLASVHPRARGEHSSCSCRNLLRSGSSPRTRGTYRRNIILVHI